ncbi:glycosyltransferase family 2 protein [Marinobacterium aestuariivivens]|uniref:Glycosyltransferase family 2 protein n=1 Tax=Marinobacterium aestuariivivens TaxID=1698799 RepID=A0ABW1ZUJ4_9GAMM
MGDSNCSQLVSVVIPYYQSNRGLLKKCVESIFSQRGGFCIQVIVVDDSSPVPAREELVGLFREGQEIIVLNQENAGPGAARNNGLNHMPMGTRYVAFVDSDDCWREDFLLHAMGAMERGYDIFFANSRRVGFEYTRFEWKSEDGLDLVASDHQMLDGERSLYAFSGDFLSYAIKRSNIISTSALVYRLDVAPNLRFSTRLFNGQDRLFKLALSQMTNKVAFSSHILVDEGLGINIFDSAAWGTPKSLVLLTNYLNLSKCILAELSLEDSHRAFVAKQLADTRYSLVASIVHLLKTGQKLDWSLVLRASRTDPAFILMFVPNLLQLVWSKVKSSV